MKKKKNAEENFDTDSRDGQDMTDEIHEATGATGFGCNLDPDAVSKGEDAGKLNECKIDPANVVSKCQECLKLPKKTVGAIGYGHKFCLGSNVKNDKAAETPTNLPLGRCDSAEIWDSKGCKKLFGGLSRTSVYQVKMATSAKDCTDVLPPFLKQHYKLP